MVLIPFEECRQKLTIKAAYLEKDDDAPYNLE